LSSRKFRKLVYEASDKNRRLDGSNMRTNTGQS